VVNSYPGEKQEVEDERQFIRRTFRGDYRMSCLAEDLIERSGLDSLRLPTVLVCAKGDPRVDECLVVAHEAMQSSLAAD